MTILVFGGTAGTGKKCTELLIARGDKVRVAARNAEKVRGLFGDQVECALLDLEKPGPAFAAAFAGARSVIFTAAVPAGPASNRRIEAVDCRGVEAMLAAAKEVGFKGRIIYMTTIGLYHRTFFIALLNFIKGRHFIHWRSEAEKAIMSSGLDAVIVRAGALTNSKVSKRLQISQGDRALTFGTLDSFSTRHPQ